MIYLPKFINNQQFTYKEKQISRWIQFTVKLQQCHADSRIYAPQTLPKFSLIYLYFINWKNVDKFYYSSGKVALFAISEFIMYMDNSKKNAANIIVQRRCYWTMSWVSTCTSTESVFAILKKSTNGCIQRLRPHTLQPMTSRNLLTNMNFSKIHETATRCHWLKKIVAGVDRYLHWNKGDTLGLGVKLSRPSKPIL
jgi:hypothetical protein